MISDVVKTARSFTSANSTQILTAIGAVGTATTAYLAVKGAIQAEKILRLDAYENQGNVFYYHDIRDRTRMTWKCYIPAATTGAVTVTAILAANRIGSQRTAAMAAAYTLTDRAFAEYKDKVVEKVGQKKSTLIRDEVVQDKVNKTEVPGTVLVNESDKQICFDAYSGRYFLSTMEEIRSSLNRLNHYLLQADYVSLSDFYDFIGLEHTSFSDNVGWSNEKLVDLEFTSCLTIEQKPAIAFNFRVAPTADFQRFH